jgi:hypothetical protein
VIVGDDLRLWAIKSCQSWCNCINVCSLRVDDGVRVSVAEELSEEVPCVGVTYNLRGIDVISWSYLLTRVSNARRGVRCID